MIKHHYVLEVLRPGNTDNCKNTILRTECYDGRMRAKPLGIDSKERTQSNVKCGPIAPVTRFLCVSWNSGTLRRGVIRVDDVDVRAWQMDKTERRRKVGLKVLDV